MAKQFSILTTLFLPIAALMLAPDYHSAGRDVQVVSNSESVDSKTITVGIHDNYFQPPILQVMPGDTVRWVNQGRHTHTITTGKGREYLVTPGASLSLTLHGPAKLNYYCRFHSLQSMRGVILIGAVGNEVSREIGPFDAGETALNAQTCPCCREAR